ncbi:DNA polymerase III subunit epsilon [Azospirillum sp. TSH58]|uniref:3'-5' exonuclease n=1 Tax=Azospirillum sp. TSH58 TaxID=664962 RepID=UPI000D6017D8|nr:3'-5' exonuclease [Azospirillum sp. TSH58]AWJ85144.1 DNA polymerase III subunit epsilon [Azospirillum sp. TSH58]PWC80819.1 hypothetical protein TSH58_00820 [Azospirillum sp. TSH58]
MTAALIFDTETTDLPLWSERSTHPDQPHIVQLAALLSRADGDVSGSMNVIVRPSGYTSMPQKAFETHGISFERAMDEGIPLADALDEFNALMALTDELVAHNISFDVRLMRIAFLRAGKEPARENLPKVCTMTAATRLVNLPPTDRMRAAGFNKPKSPSLAECIRHFFGEDLDGAHDAMVDVRACARVYWHLKGLGVAPAKAAPAKAPAPKVSAAGLDLTGVL